MKNRLSTQEMLNSWEERRREGDIREVANRTWYSQSHVSNMVNGRRTLNEQVARELYRISRRRTSNAILRSHYPGVNVEVEFAPVR